MIRKLNKSKAVLFAAVLCIVMFTVTIYPLSVNAAGPSGTSVRVGYYENEVFQEGANDDSVKTGYAYEYYQKLSEYTGWRYEYVYGEFGDLYKMLLNGEIDFLAGLAYREDRKDLIGYPDAAMGNETYSLVKHDIDTDITLDTSTLNGRKIGVLDSAMVEVLQKFLNEHSIQAEVVKFNDYEPLFDAFDNHEIDVLAAEGDGAYGRDHAERDLTFWQNLMPHRPNWQSMNRTISTISEINITLSASRAERCLKQRNSGSLSITNSESDT